MVLSDLFQTNDYFRVNMMQQFFAFLEDRPIISREICDKFFPEFAEFQGPNPEDKLDLLKPPF